MSQEVTCINKNNRTSAYERITHIGWPGKKITVEQAIKDIRKDSSSYYVKKGTHIVYLIVAERNGVEYVKTEKDGDTPDNLLSLPECP